MNILGITVSDTLTSLHFNITTPPLLLKARFFYAIKAIGAHGFHGSALLNVTRATLVAQLLYASPAWWRYLKADERSRLQADTKKAIGYGYLPPIV